jgi:hypothetical protein
LLEVFNPIQDRTKLPSPRQKKAPPRPIPWRHLLLYWHVEDAANKTYATESREPRKNQGNYKTDQRTPEENAHTRPQV